MQSTNAKLAEDQTTQRLLAAAGEVFAEMGYRAATTREIAQRAQANVAAIHYHFGDKEKLYSAVMHEAVCTATEKYPLTMELGEHPTPEQRLHAFIRAFLFRLLDEGRPAWQGKLMVREMVDPTPILDTLVEKVMRPQFEVLSGIVADLLASRATPGLVLYCGASVVGQCLFYRHAQPVIQRIAPQQKFASQDIEVLADHITAFSLAAIRNMPADGSAAEPPTPLK